MRKGPSFANVGNSLMDLKIEKFKVKVDVCKLINMLFLLLLIVYFKTAEGGGDVW